MTPTEFLTTLWGEKPPGLVLIWTLPDKRSTWFSDFTNVDRFVAAQKGKDVYTGVSIAPMGARLGGTHRISNNISAGVAGLWADIDIAGPYHQKENLPPNVLAAIDAIAGIGYEPSITVHSGHGIQCWWLHKQPWIFQDAPERPLAQQLSQSWHDLVAAEFNRHSWTVDSTHDLARVMRLPGTMNHKGEPVPVEVIETSNFRWRSLPNLPKTSPTALPEPQRATLPLAVGELHLSEDLEPNPRVLHIAMTEIKGFARSWNNQRTFKDGDESASVYDLSIASYAAHAGIGDQDIVALLVAHRRRNGQDLKLRDDYYRRTIAKARSA